MQTAGNRHYHHFLSFFHEKRVISQNGGTMGGILAMTMAENASLLRSVVMYWGYPKTRSAEIPPWKETQDVPTDRQSAGNRGDY